jgi:DNA-binding beta-propeller fold protein YncE
MARTRRSAYILLAALLLAPTAAAAQPDMAPTNDLPNPYRTIEGWAKMPDGRTWGATSAVEIDPDGASIWVAERCAQNSCRDSDLDPILKFDANGNLVTSFGKGLLASPHGIDVDHEGNVWVTDCACTGGGGRGRGGEAPAGPPKGHQVFKFSPTGQLLMTLGTAGGVREPGHFFQPNDVHVAPNGDIFVAEGHSSSETANARILKFRSDGTFIMAFGTKGDGPGQFDQPHALAMDSQGRLFVGDRSNNRIVIYTQDGQRLDAWYQFSRPSGIFIDSQDRIYVADSESGSVNPPHGAWKRGIRIGSARDGSITAFIPDPAEDPPSTSAAEGVAVDSRGNIYGAEVGPRALKKYVRNP